MIKETEPMLHGGIVLSGEVRRFICGVCND